MRYEMFGSSFIVGSKWAIWQKVPGRKYHQVLKPTVKVMNAIRRRRWLRLKFPKTMLGYEKIDV